MLTTHAAVSSTAATLIRRSWDGVIEQTTPGSVWVLRHELTRFKKHPAGAGIENLIKAVFWSKEAGRAYVKSEYGFDDSEWFEGDPDGGFDTIVTMNEREQLILMLDKTPLVP